MPEPGWTAEPEVEQWLEWAIEVMGWSAWVRRRTDAERFNQELEARMRGDVVASFADPIRPSDQAAWYLYQCDLYLHEPRRFDMPLCSRLIPAAIRLGTNLDVLKAIPRAHERLRRALVVTPDEIDSTLFELLVAQAYATHGWDDVAFVAEDPARATPDLTVRHQGTLVSVECKRKRAIPEYVRREREHWWRISDPVRRALAERDLQLVVDYVFHVPLATLPEDVLERRVLPLLELAIPGRIIDDKEMTVSTRPVDLRRVRRTLRRSLIRQDGSGLNRDLFGHTEPWRGITSTLCCKPSNETPRYLEDITWAAASIWSCDAPEAVRAKAQHYRRELADAVRQLPVNQPSIVHIGAEAYDGGVVEAVRHERLNNEMIESFDTGGRELEVIYSHIFRAEVPFDENWAVEEDAHYWLRRPSSARYLLRPPGILAPDA